MWCCPAIVYIWNNLAEVEKVYSKSSITLMMITGSTAASKAIPPHFLFSMTTTSKERMQICSDLLRFMPNVKGQFGSNTVKEWPVSFGMNSKGGTYGAKYKKYFLSIVPLFPDLEDKTGLWIMLKVDSRPGRLQPNL